MYKRIFQSIIILAILAASFASAGSALAWGNCASYITVQWGDTLSGIAAQCGTTVYAIQAAILCHAGFFIPLWSGRIKD